jgi:RimJ/RimL family protein N-acetyltransferase
MTITTNPYGQQIGPALNGWTPPPRPSRMSLEGRYCRIEPLDAERHASDLHEANREAADGRFWTYLSHEPFTELEPYQGWMRQAAAGEDPLFFAVRDLRDGRAAGLFAYMRIDPAAGSIELGHVNFSPRLQRTRVATEAVYLMLAHAFETLGYRRFEWKCDSLNAPSRAAALRFGFTFEGIFRQATVYKGRSRDTAWFSIIDGEWPALAAAYRAWLAPDNFDEAGLQRAPLGCASREIPPSSP